MFKVKTGQPDVAYCFYKKDLFTAAGVDTDDPFLIHSMIVEIVSSDPSVVEVKPDAVDCSAGTIHFGKPGYAIITTNARSGLSTFHAEKRYAVVVDDAPETIPDDPEFTSDTGLSLAGLEQSRVVDPPVAHKTKHK